MEGNIENFGKVTFKVKLDDVYHDFVLEWSEESQCYEGQQLFKQLESITGIPVKYTAEMQIFGGPHPPTLPISVWNRASERSKSLTFTPVEENLLCNNLAKEVMRCKSQLDCDCFALKFSLYCVDDKHFYIRYGMVTSAAVPAECRRDSLFCHFAHTKVILKRMKSIITNAELNAQVKNALPDTADTPDAWHKVFRDFNVAQYGWLPCSRWDHLLSHHYHVYLRNRG